MAEDTKRTGASAQVRREEERVEQRSAVFPKELGLTDLVLTQIVFVVGTMWVGTAAKLGNQQLFFWLLRLSPSISRWLWSSSMSIACCRSKGVSTSGPSSPWASLWASWLHGTYGSSPSLSCRASG